MTAYKWSGIPDALTALQGRDQEIQRLRMQKDLEIAALRERIEILSGALERLLRFVADQCR